MSNHLCYNYYSNVKYNNFHISVYLLTGLDDLSVLQQYSEIPGITNACRVLPSARTSAPSRPGCFHDIISGKNQRKILED